jgi:hypothetical protein
MKLADIPQLLRENGISAMTIFPSGQIHFTERCGACSFARALSDFEKATDAEIQRRRMYTPGPEKKKEALC